MKKQLKRIENEKLTFNLSNFEGPLDLLLHLAKTNEIEISDISLNNLIEQYLEYINEVQQYDIDISSAYLEMAAELIRLKTQSIIPTLSNDEDYLEELEELSIDREELIERLLEYKKYKEVTHELDELQETRLNFFSRNPDKLKEYRNKAYQESLSLDDFINAAKSFLITIEKNKSETKILNVEETSIEQNVTFLENLEDEFDLFEKFKTLTKTNRLNLFLAILECLKLQYITFVKDEQSILIIPLNKEKNE